MNKATLLYDNFFAITGDKEAAKKCVLVFTNELQKIITGQFQEHQISWWAYRLEEIREDLCDL